MVVRGYISFEWAIESSCVAVLEPSEGSSIALEPLDDWRAMLARVRSSTAEIVLRLGTRSYWLGDGPPPEAYMTGRGDIPVDVIDEVLYARRGSRRRESAALLPVKDGLVLSGAQDADWTAGWWATLMNGITRVNHRDSDQVLVLSRYTTERMGLTIDRRSAPMEVPVVVRDSSLLSVRCAALHSGPTPTDWLPVLDPSGNRLVRTTESVES